MSGESFIFDKSSEDKTKSFSVRIKSDKGPDKDTRSDTEPAGTKDIKDFPGKKKGKPKISTYLWLAFVIGAFILALWGYFFVINPTFVEKPYVARPDVPDLETDLPLSPGPDVQGSGSAVETDTMEDNIDDADDYEVEPEHLDYLMNEIDAYKLHSPPLADDSPVIEILVSDEKKYFAVTVNDGIVDTKEGRADNPDIRISGSKLTILEMLNEDDLISAISSYASEGKVWVEPLKDKSTLAAKGYLAIYESIS